MKCGYCQQQIKKTATAAQPFGAMHIKCFFIALDNGEVAPPYTHAPVASQKSGDRP